MIVKCIAIDDEPLALRQIKSYIDRAEQLELVAACRSALEAQQILSQTKVDLIFVDINMPDMNGLDFVRSLDTAHHIVFTTAHPEFAIDGFKLNALDYLLKPFTFEEFMKATHKVISLVDLMQRCHAAENAINHSEAENKDKEFITVKADYKTQLVRVADIVYFMGARADACDFIRASDLCVSASRSEGMPFNLIEALGCGVTVLASDIKGHVDLIENGVDGFALWVGKCRGRVRVEWV
jgi:DNA-binding NarL/FixJ family response regulator